MSFAVQRLSFCPFGKFSLLLVVSGGVIQTKVHFEQYLEEVLFSFLGVLQSYFLYLNLFSTFGGTFYRKSFA